MSDTSSSARSRALLLAGCFLALVLALLTPGAATAATGMQVTGQERLTPRLVEYTMATPALKAPVQTRILFPADYGVEPSRRYPVLYLLHGGFGKVTDWTTAGEAERLTAGLDLIVVMPEDGNGGWYTDWWNGGKGGAPAWETFHLGQLLPWVDATFRTVADRGHRAIAGLSTGGYGAMHDAARHPDLFSFAASFSGAVDLLDGPAIRVVIGAEARADGGQPDDVFGNRDTHTIGWRAGNPVDLAANLRGVRLQVRTGNGKGGGPFNPEPKDDAVEQTVHAMSVTFHKRLQRLGIPHVWDDYGAGNHSYAYWRRDLEQTLPAMMASFAAPPKAPSPFTFTSADRTYEIYGFRVDVRRSAGQAFTTLAGAGPRGFRFTGTGTATVRTPATYAPGSRHAVRAGGRTRQVRADGQGRLRLAVTARDGQVRITP